MKTIWIIRIATFFLLVFLATKPVAVRPEPNTPLNWSFLIDTSASMRVKDPSERLSRAQAAFSTLVKKMKSESIYQFAAELLPLKADEVKDLKPLGKKSDLAMAIQKSIANKNVRGAVVFTDGRQVGADDAIATAASVGKPLFLVGVGDKSLFKDIAVRGVQAPPFAFKNVQAVLSATLSVVGFPNKDVTVTLREGEKTLSIQKVHVTGNEIETTVTFAWTPTSVGTKSLTVEAESYAGEVTTLNNRKEISLDVGRDRFRVLYICGEPGPEYGFLRHQFKSDPAVELVTFVILRNASNTVNIPEGELSLIPFPTQDVLINQMSTFDLVVFEEFAYQSYGLSPSVVYAIRQKVQEGGSFLLMGGQTAFGPGSGYAIPGVREMIPVEIGGSDVKTVDQPVSFIAKAPAHPILRLEENSERNKEVWQSLPPLDGVTLLPAVKPGALVLGSASIQGKEYPIFTVWKYGKGRVGALSTRTTWRWSMVNGSKQQISDVYQRFWKNMVLWLTHSDEFKLVRIGLENKSVRLDEAQTAHVWVVDDYFKPLSDVDVQIQLTSPNGTKETLSVHPETNGVFAATFKPHELGIHQIQTWVTRNGKRFGGDSLSTRVVENFSEEEDLRPNFDLLRELAHVTAGKFVPIDQFSPSVFDAFNSELNSTRGRKVLLWNSPWFMAGLMGLLFVEWILRKKKGLP